MSRNPKFLGYFYFIMASFFVFFAINQNNRTEGWDVFTILFMAVAAVDYMLAFRHFGRAKKQGEQKK